MTDNVASALCYVLGVLTGVLFLVLEPYNRNRNVRFHAFQAIFFGLGTVVLWIGLFICSAVLHFIPFIGTMISLLLFPVVGLGLFVLWLLLMYKAYNGEHWVLPVIGPLAEKQA
jgi:uncharacterized membrane protein